MINSKMRFYDYSLYENTDAYGQPALSETKGFIKMSITIASQSVRDSVSYSGAEFIGLTMSDVTDKYVFNYDGMKLKVLYVNKDGRYNQVYMTRM